MNKNQCNGWLLVSITFLIGVLLCSCIVGLDVAAGLNCEEMGCDCGHPFILNALFPDR